MNVIAENLDVFVWKKVGVARDHLFAPEILSCESRTETGIPKILGH